MTSIITERKFLIESPEEFIKTKINDILNENDNFSSTIFNNPPKEAIEKQSKTIEKQSKPVFKDVKGEIKKRKYFIPKYYI